MLDIVLHTKNDSLAIDKSYTSILIPALSLVCSPQDTDTVPEFCEEHFKASTNNIIDLSIALTCECEGCATNKLKEHLSDFLKSHADERVLVVFGHIHPSEKKNIKLCLDYLDEGLELSYIKKHLLSNIFY